MQKVTITAGESGQRLDKFLLKYLGKAPKSFIYKMLRKKNITLDGKKASGSEKIAEGSLITFWLSDETIGAFRSESDIFAYDGLPDPEVIYEDEQIIVMNKPAGLLSQKADAGDTSMNEIMIHYLLQTGQLAEETLQSFHPSVCNRLDRNTSGLITGGKTLAALQFLSRGFKERWFDKKYLTLVKGKIDTPAHVKGSLVKDPKTNMVSISQSSIHHADRIETAYRPLCSNGRATLLEVDLITGRTHQIRAHLASTGHPVIGDRKYGDPAVNDAFRKDHRVKHQLLHAYSLTFENCDKAFLYLEGMRITAPLPALMERVLTGEGFDPSVWEK